MIPQQLNVEIQEVEELLIGLILEGKVEGRIDQVGMRLELETKSAIIFSRWTLDLSRLFQTKPGEKTLHRFEEVD